MSSLCCSDPWIYHLTDSSYDSPENELDNSSGGSPGFCNRRRVPSKPRQGSYDSILTFSDYDQDNDPDRRHAQTILSPLGRSRGLDPDISSPDIPTMDNSSLDGRHRLRRRSEPAIAYLSKLQPRISIQADDDEEDHDGEDASGKPGSHTDFRDRDRRGEYGLTLLSGRSADLEASCSSLSSDPISPAPTRSSLDSLDSIGSFNAGSTRQGLNPPKTHLLSTSSSSLSVSSALTSVGLTDQGTCPKDTQPKEPVNWGGTLKGCRGLHPNSWLKKDRRLSLTQQDNLEKEEEDKTGVSKRLTLLHETGAVDRNTHLIYFCQFIFNHSKIGKRTALLCSCDK